MLVIALKNLLHDKTQFAADAQRATLVICHSGSGAI
jgi:hypothetical protein